MLRLRNASVSKRFSLNSINSKNIKQNSKIRINHSINPANRRPLLDCRSKGCKCITYVMQFIKCLRIVSINNTHGQWKEFIVGERVSWILATLHGTNVICAKGNSFHCLFSENPGSSISCIKPFVANKMSPFGTVSLTKRWNMESRHDVDSQILTRKNFITRGYILNTLKNQRPIQELCCMWYSKPLPKNLWLNQASRRKLVTS